MSDLARVQQLINKSLASDIEQEQRFALVMQTVLRMREAVQLEHDIEHDQLTASLLVSGVSAIDACIDILSMFWGPEK